jgi:hypothetical protein
MTDLVIGLSSVVFLLLATIFVANFASSRRTEGVESLEVPEVEEPVKAPVKEVVKAPVEEPVKAPAKEEPKPVAAKAPTPKQQPIQKQSSTKGRRRGRPARKDGKKETGTSKK